jgi:hypothetical protein
MATPVERSSQTRTHARHPGSAQQAGTQFAPTKKIHVLRFTVESACFISCPGKFAFFVKDGLHNPPKTRVEA